MSIMCPMHVGVLSTKTFVIFAEYDSIIIAELLRGDNQTGDGCAHLHLLGTAVQIDGFYFTHQRFNHFRHHFTLIGLSLRLIQFINVPWLVG